MKICKHLLFSITISLLTTASANAAENTAKLKQLLPGDCIFSSRFTQEKKIQALPSPLRSSGTLFFSCRHGLIWKSETPFNESVIYTIKNLHFRHIDNQEITALESQQHHYLANFLLDLLSADTSSIEKNFSISAETDHNITLTPTNNLIQKGLDSIRLEKPPEKNDLLITILDTKSQTTQLSIQQSSATPNQTTKDISQDCNNALNNDLSCQILSEPSRFQVINSDN